MAAFARRVVLTSIVPFGFVVATPVASFEVAFLLLSLAAAGTFVAGAVSFGVAPDVRDEAEAIRFEEADPSVEPERPAGAESFALLLGLLSLEATACGAAFVFFAVRADAALSLASRSHAITSCMGSGSRGSDSGFGFGSDLDPPPKSLTTNVYLPPWRSKLGARSRPPTGPVGAHG
jgi:hypothetical protein